LLLLLRKHPWLRTLLASRHLQVSRCSWHGARLLLRLLLALLLLLLLLLRIQLLLFPRPWLLWTALAALRLRLGLSPTEIPEGARRPL